jgi:hypothetical protein
MSDINSRDCWYIADLVRQSLAELSPVRSMSLIDPALTPTQPQPIAALQIELKDPHDTIMALFFDAACVQRPSKTKELGAIVQAFIDDARAVAENTHKDRSGEYERNWKHEDPELYDLVVKAEALLNQL